MRTFQETPAVQFRKGLLGATWSRRLPKQRDPEIPVSLPGFFPELTFYSNELTDAFEALSSGFGNFVSHWLSAKMETFSIKAKGIMYLF